MIQADGGTRTASICGVWLALHDAIAGLLARGALSESPLLDHVAAVSVGVSGPAGAGSGLPGRFRLRHRHECGDDRRWRLCRNPGHGQKAHPFSREEMAQSLALAEQGITELVALQRQRWQTDDRS